ncbi:unnamed protein product [Oikopleura dioica]|uniref:Lipocalin/cytosolic fatty-acid binding domain-containing protein n=1 Tax=Oikopleura dioica TaxID=34765 RepID=E4XXI0_OIKDI|nr:unnamed protein product [Oikopleura dioica]
MKYLLALATVCYSQVITPGGRCPIPPNMQDFSAADYSGQWYQVAGYPVYYIPEGTDCVRATYEIEEGYISVNNSSVRKDEDGQKYLSWGLAKAYQSYGSRWPNLLYVDFRNEYDPAKPLDPQYWIFEVDYDEYTVGMECKQYDDFSYMIMWILARDPEFVNTVKFQEVVDRAAALYEVDPEKLVFLDDSENGCAYEYIKGDHGL